ncbi:MAG: hypothetical protein JWM68_4574 [Verrucomicrobiales bacterium]|nr:hypothetical protein [Verrucomicrobiales bacterium]
MVAIVIATGLFWRSRFCPLSPFLIKYGGDALWSLMVLLGFGILFVRASIVRIALMALSFSFAIEFSQLYHAPWIDTLRDTRPGALILGSTFNAPDLLAYATGITIGALAEIIFMRPAPKTVAPKQRDEMRA